MEPIRVAGPKGKSLAGVMVLLALALVTGLASPLRAAGADHPRIFFRAEELTAGRDLRARVALTGSHCEEYALLLGWAQEQRGRPLSALLSDPELAQEAALTYAFLYQLSQSASEADWAVALTKALITSQTGRLPGFDWPRLPATVATVFDWTYDHLSSEDRQRLLYDVLKRCIYVHDRKVPQPQEPFDPAPYLRPLLFASLALEGEPEASRYVPGWKEFCRRTLSERVLPDLKEFGAQGAWLPRAGGLCREQDVLECLEAWRSATGEQDKGPEPLALPLPAHFQHLSRRLLYRLRPGLVLAGLEGDPPRTAAVPPELVYLLSHYEDDPVGRWLAEALRVEESPAPGSAAWLRDLRARILWLGKGQRRLSPGEAQLPLAACFEDRGEVVARGTWDLTTESDVWCLLTTSAARARSPAYWNHLGLVRGRDALAVEVNVTVPTDATFADAWSGRPRSQNTVVPDVGGQGKERFALESCLCRRGFTYARGRVSRPVRGAARHEFARQLLAFPEGVVVVYDRVEAAPGRPTWLLHTLDPPRLLGTTRKTAGLPGAGISESNDARGATWQTGRSQAHLQVLLPRQRLMRAIGGKDYEFWVEAAGENAWPAKAIQDGVPVPYGAEELRALEVGAWRIEVAPIEAREVTEFLVVLTAGDVGTAEPKVSGQAEDGQAEVTVAYGGRTYHAVFGKAGGGSVEVKDEASGRIVLSERFGAAEGRAE